MHLPGPLRAAVGFVASAADEAKRLPDRAFELPMLAVSTALQASVRAQQRYAQLTARGDEVLNRSRPTDEPPEWAQFDAPVPVEDLGRSTSDRRASEIPPPADEIAGTAPVQKSPVKKSPAKKAAARRAAAKKAPAKKAPAKKSPAKSAPARRTSAAEPPAMEPSAENAAAESPPAANAATEQPTAIDVPAEQQPSTGTSITASVNGKTISKPRHTPPSRFDDVADD